MNELASGACRVATAAETTSTKQPTEYQAAEVKDNHWGTHTHTDEHTRMDKHTRKSTETTSQCHVLVELVSREERKSYQKLCHFQFCKTPANHTSQVQSYYI